MRVYSFSDEEDDNVQNSAKDKDGWIVAVKPTNNGSSLSRKRKRPNVIKDSDSELEDFQIGNVAKTLRTSGGGQSEKRIDDISVDVSNIDENVPLFELECIATIAGSSTKRNSDKPHTKSRPDDSPEDSNTPNDACVPRNISEANDASPTLAYDDPYDAETEEFINEKQSSKPCQDGLDEAEVLLVGNDTDETSKKPSVSASVVSPSKSSNAVRPEESPNHGSKQTDAADDVSENAQPDDPCLVDSSTTLSVLRKSRKSRQKLDLQSSQNSEASVEGAAVTSSENRKETISDVKTSTKISSVEKATPCVNSNSGTETADSKESKHTEDVEELASTSETKSVNLLQQRTSENVEISSGSLTQTKPLRASPAGDVSSMPKSNNDADAPPNQPEGGVSSSKESTPSKTRENLRSAFVCPPAFRNSCFEELRFRYYLKSGRMAEGNDERGEEAAPAANSSAASKVQKAAMSEEDLKRTVEEVCSDVLPAASVSEGVSSSLSAKQPQKHSQDRPKEMTAELLDLDDVASTSDNRECEVVGSSKGKPVGVRTHERNARHQSPGIASSSDDQESRSIQRTVEVEESETSSSVSATAAASKRPLRKGQGTVPSGDEVETSTAVSKREKMQQEEVNVPSDGEAETSTSDLVTRNRDTNVAQKVVTSEAEVKETSSSSTSNSVTRTQQGTEAGQRTVTPDPEAPMTSSSSTPSVSSARMAGGRRDRGYIDAVESSGLDSDGSGPVPSRTRRMEERGGGRQVEIGSSDEAAVSRENTRITAKVREDYV